MSPPLFNRLSSLALKYTYTLSSL